MTIPPQTLVLGLGSNVGESRALLAAAIREIAGRLMTPLQVSSLYRSQALLPENAPAEWDIPFLNMAVSGPCTFSPEVVLAEVKSIERMLGRQDRGRWAPREIDIDLLAYGDTVMTTPALTLPHAQLNERAFALLPFAELHPGWRHPVDGWHMGTRAAELAAEPTERLDSLWKASAHAD